MCTLLVSMHPRVAIIRTLATWYKRMQLSPLVSLGE